jgi:hypothetical protein
MQNSWKSDTTTVWFDILNSQSGATTKHLVGSSFQFGSSLCFICAAKAHPGTPLCPNITIHPEHNLASQCARQFAVDLDNLHTMLKTKIMEAQCRYQRSADSRQLPAPEFAVGNKVFVKAQFFWMTRPSKKLSEKYLSPYDIIAHPGTHSFMLRLPNSMHSVHPVFHVSMLEPTTPNSFPECSDPLPAPVVVDGELEYEISCIVNSKIDRQ